MSKFVESIKSLVRPYITTALTTTMCYLFIMGKIPPKEIIPVVGIIVAFHYAERGLKKKEKTDEQG